MKTKKIIFPSRFKYSKCDITLEVSILTEEDLDVNTPELATKNYKTNQVCAFRKANNLRQFSNFSRSDSISGLTSSYHEGGPKKQTNS